MSHDARFCTFIKPEAYAGWGPTPRNHPLAFIYAPRTVSPHSTVPPSLPAAQGRTNYRTLGICFSRLVEPLPTVVRPTIKRHPLTGAQVYPLRGPSLANALSAEPRHTVLVVRAALEDGPVPATSQVSQAHVRLQPCA